MGVAALPRSQRSAHGVQPRARVEGRKYVHRVVEVNGAELENIPTYGSGDGALFLEYHGEDGGWHPERRDLAVLLAEGMVDRRRVPRLRTEGLFPEEADAEVRRTRLLVRYLHAFTQEETLSRDGVRKPEDMGTLTAFASLLQQEANDPVLITEILKGAFERRRGRIVEIDIVNHELVQLLLPLFPNMRLKLRMRGISDFPSPQEWAAMKEDGRFQSMRKERVRIMVLFSTRR